MSILSALAKAAEVVSETAGKAAEGSLKATEGVSEAGGLKASEGALPEFAAKETMSAESQLDGMQHDLPEFYDQGVGEKSDLPDFDKGDVSEAGDSSEEEGMPDVTEKDAAQAEDATPIKENVSTEGVDGGGDAIGERKQGGTYGELISNDQWGGHLEDHPPHEVHHMPADSVNGLERNDGPAIVMEKADHRQTASCGNSLEAREYRAKQKELIDQGKFKEAMQMDIDDIHEKFGDKYDDAIAQMQEVAKEKGLI